MTAQKRLAEDKVVQAARELGFMAYGYNATARRHFGWFLPDCEENQCADFEVHIFGQTINYKVGNQGTSHQPSAIKWLRELVERTEIQS